MKHFWQTYTSDNNNINLLNEKDGEARTCYEMFGAVCRGCGCHSSNLDKKVVDSWNTYVEKLKQNSIIYGSFIWLYDSELRRKEMLKFADKYIKDNKLDECDGKYEKVIKTKDIDFVNFLVENRYKILSSHSIGRADSHKESTGEISGSKGIFSGKMSGSFSSESNTRRLDIIEFILQKEEK
jgi:antitoxin component YwqK of YwqJK toxin-antitoxin module